jgi:hypothetical protein
MEVIKIAVAKSDSVNISRQDKKSKDPKKASSKLAGRQVR